MITSFTKLEDIVTHFRKDLTGNNRPLKDLVLFFAHNGTGKTRLSMEYKEMGKETIQSNLTDEGGNILTDEEGNSLTTTEIRSDTLYFNAFSIVSCTRS